MELKIAKLVNEMDIREQIIEAAKSFLGTLYSKLDCSAFVRAVFRKFGYELPRTSVEQAKHLYNKKLTIEFSKSASVKEIMAKLQKGDIVFWTKKCSCGRWKEIHHVSIYDQDGINYESSSSKGKVVRRSLWESSSWQIVFIADITSLLKPEEVEEVLKKGDKNEAVYYYQKTCLKAGFNPLKAGAAWKDLKTGEVNGCDGEFGDYMVTLTKQIQSKYGLKQTGELDALTYGRLASGIDTGAGLQITIDALNAKIETARKALS